MYTIFFLVTHSTSPIAACVWPTRMQDYKAIILFSIYQLVGEVNNRSCTRSGRRKFETWVSPAQPIKHQANFWYAVEFHVPNNGENEQHQLRERFGVMPRSITKSFNFLPSLYVLYAQAQHII